jgi:AAA+ superfamily predicted ATPase
VILTITSTAHPATDLGYLLHKNPNRVQSFELSFGKVHVFYPEASLERCTVALLLDVDPVALVRTLIARAREELGSACQELLLNKLLSEMDGLREDADVIFVLTTNRPDHLEPALASRPGRIDQAIEFPLPNEEARAKLIQLYSRGLVLSQQLVELIVRKTKGASPAFIKELMRLSAQFQFELGKDGALEQRAIDGALEEMLFSGGTLNVKLLGGSAAELNPAQVN